MAKLTNIIIHCSDSDFGDAQTIDFWHKQRGWKGIQKLKCVMNRELTPSEKSELDVIVG